MTPSPQFFLMHLLRGVGEPARLSERIAAFRDRAGGALAGATALFAGDAIEKGQSGPDRRSDLSGDPLFLTVTPLADEAAIAAARRSADQQLADGARGSETWALRLQFEQQSTTTNAAPADDWLQIVMMNVEPSIEGEFNDWYEQEHVARIAAAAPEFVGVQRMEALVGTPRYAALWRMKDRKAPERDPWLSASETPWTTRIRRFMRDRRRLLLAPREL